MSDKELHFKEIYDGETGSIKDRVLMEGPPPNGGNGGSDFIFEHDDFDLLWKRAGSSDHPDLSAQNLIAAKYTKIGKVSIGFQITLDFTIEILDASKLGSGPNGKGWYFQVADPLLAPNFDDKSTEVPGEMQIWVNDNHIDVVGGCKWSRNVGSGKDGILLNINGGSQPISESWPRSWPNGSKIRVQITYFK